MDRFSGELAILREERERVREQLFAGITSALPQGEGLFPAGARQVSPELVDALTYVFLASRDTASLPEVAQRKLRAWALDLRRFGFPPTAYEVVARVVREVVGAGIEARFVLEDAAAVMAGAAAAADVEGVPAAAAARVLSVTSDGGAITVVRVEAGMPVSYAPGQYLPVMQVGRQGVWRNLAPALPSNPFGQLEFHVRDELTPEVGGYITMGAARGESPELAGEELSITAVGTGSAAAKAIVFSALELDDPPRTRVHLAGHCPQRDVFERLAASVAWLTMEDSPALAGRVVLCGPHRAIGALGLPEGAATRALRISPDAPADWSYQP